MIKTLPLPDGTTLSYEIRRKQVKNLNLHIEKDGAVWISAGKRHQDKEIETFLYSKRDWLTKHLSRIKNQQKTPADPYFTEDELVKTIHGFCQEIYPYYKEKGIPYPQIKFRKMTSQWGNCRPKQGILTFNKSLRFAPKDCVWYVVCHEWTHFLVPNHSEVFYGELGKVCPEWKEQRKRLKEVKIQ